MKQAHQFIAVDLDDVLFDFIGAFFHWHNTRYGTALRPEDMVQDAIWKVWGGTKEEAIDRVPRFFQEIDMQGIAPMDGAAGALLRLKSHHRLAIVSARDPSSAGVTRAWIDKYLPDIFEDVVLGIGDPMAGSRPSTKAEICKALGADTLIDDQLAHAEKAVAEGINFLLFGDRPWNQADPLPQGIERVQDWDHVARIL